MGRVEVDRSVTLIRGRVENAYVAAACGIYGCDSLTKRADTDDCDWTVVGVGWKSVRHARLSFVRPVGGSQNSTAKTCEARFSPNPERSNPKEGGYATVALQITLAVCASSVTRH